MRKYRGFLIFAILIFLFLFGCSEILEPDSHYRLRYNEVTDEYMIQRWNTTYKVWNDCWDCLPNVILFLCLQSQA